MGSRAAEKVLKQMLNSRNKAGFMPNQLETLYLGFGFIKEEGSNHTTYKYPNSKLYTQVPRHRPVKPKYVEIAIDLITSIKASEGEKSSEKSGT